VALPKPLNPHQIVQRAQTCERIIS